MSPADRMRDDALAEARALEPLIYHLHKEASRLPSGSIITPGGSGGDSEPANIHALVRLRAIAQGLKSLKKEVLQ